MPQCIYIQRRREASEETERELESIANRYFSAWAQPCLFTKMRTSRDLNWRRLDFHFRPPLSLCFCVSIRCIIVKLRHPVVWHYCSGSVLCTVLYLRFCGLDQGLEVHHHGNSWATSWFYCTSKHKRTLSAPALGSESVEKKAKRGQSFIPS